MLFVIASHLCINYCYFVWFSMWNVLSLSVYSLCMAAKKVSPLDESKMCIQSAFKALKVWKWIAIDWYSVVREAQLSLFWNRHINEWIYLIPADKHFLKAITVWALVSAHPYYLTYNTKPLAILVNAFLSLLFSRKDESLTVFTSSFYFQHGILLGFASWLDTDWFVIIVLALILKQLLWKPNRFQTVKWFWVILFLKIIIRQNTKY